MTGSQDDAPSTERRSSRDKEEESKLFKVFLGGIPRTMDEEELFDVFRNYNPSGAMVMRDMATKRSRGFAFITFPCQKDMDRAISELHNTRINGRLVTVTEARPFQRQRDRSPSRYESPERRRPLRRSDHEDRYSNHRRPHEDSYRTKRSVNHYHHSVEHSSRQGSNRYPPSDRGIYDDDRRDWRHSSSSQYHEPRRPRWRSRERPDGDYPETRRRPYSPGRHRSRAEIYNRS